MFLEIFKFELKYWFKNPLFYIYFGVLLLIALFAMGTASGLFDSITVTRSSITDMNSALAINGFINGFTIIFIFLLPSLIGSTINKDYSSNTSNVLYTYPFTKLQYLVAKFSAGLLATIIVISSLALGAMIGGYIPGTNPDLLGEFKVFNFIQPYLIYIIPNIIFFGAIVFAVVAFSRNITSGFIAILVLLLIQGVSEVLIGNLDNKELAAILDPFGSSANTYYTQYWSVDEQNENLLPFEGLIIYNRLLWGGLGLLIFAGVYWKFSFSHSALTFSLKRNKGQRVTKNNFGSMVRIDLPKLTFDYSFFHRIKNAWQISWIDFKYVITGIPFIIFSAFGLLFLIAGIATSGQIFGTSTLPVTWQMTSLGGGLFNVIALLPIVYLYTGLLMHRSRISKINQLVDVTPTPNWTFLLSKFFTLLKVQIVLLLLIMVAGICVQVYKGYYNFEIGLYLSELLGIQIWNVIIWTLLAIFIQTIIPNYLAGFFVTLALGIGINFLGSIGVEQSIFKYNEGPGTSYSDMNGYGTSLTRYFIYKGYWLLLGIVFYALSIAFWRRGVPTTINDWFKRGIKNFTTPLRTTASIAVIGFLTVGGWIYYTNNVANERTTSKERELRNVQWEKLYGKYEGIPQPRIVDVKIELDLIPETRDFKANGKFVIENKSEVAIDSIHLNHNTYPSKFSFDRPNQLALEDTTYNYDIYVLDQPLNPGDSMLFTFEMWNKPNEILRNNSPIIENGTFINNGVFPSFGYPGDVIVDNKIREKYDLPPKERMKSPYDSANLGNTYISRDADWIKFETTISTAPDQIAIAPGYLQKEWEKDGRKYFHYKMDSKMLNFYAFQSARYEVKKDKWQDIDIEIFHHKGHEYNIGRMIKGIKKSLAYYEENFSPYQHRQVRIIEFPRTGGGFAQSFANTIPYSEAIGFIAEVDDEDESGVDYPFAVTAHEVAHQWWAHQVIGANVQGATLMSESMSEYSSLKVLEKEYGKEQMRVFLKDALDKYLTGRASERLKEQPLFLNENQQYIHYNKGSLVLYAMSDYIGEEVMNNALKKYIDKVAFQEAPYTTSLEFVSNLREVTPDSLKYLIYDMFETITLYDNKVEKATYKELENGKYEVDIKAITTKYRANEKGKRIFEGPDGDTLRYTPEGKSRAIFSLPMEDWIEVGIFATKEVDGKDKEILLYLQKHRFSKIQNDLTIVVDQKPQAVGIDPYNKLIDTDSNDNRTIPAEKTD